MKRIKNTVYTYTLLMLLLSTAAPAPLAALDPEKPVNHYLLDEWGLDNGFLPDSIFSFAQTPDGYLWMGTNKGVVRYDGMKFETFILGAPRLVEERIMGDMVTDPGGTLWVACSLGLFRYKDGRFDAFTTADGLSGNFITALAVDGYGALWFGAGPKHLNRLKDGVVTVFNAEDGLSVNGISAIREDGDGVLWVGGFEKGLYYKQGDRFRKYRVEHLPENYVVHTIYRDRLNTTNTLWAATNHGLVELVKPLEKERKVTVYTSRDGLADNNTWVVRGDSHGNIWVGTSHALHRLVKTSQGRAVSGVLPLNAAIFSLFEDREKSLWIGAFYYGLKRLRDAAVTPLYKHEGVPPYQMALFKDGSGTIWMGSFFGRLFRRRDGRFHEFLQLGHEPPWGITAIAEDHEGNLLLGTAARGIFRVNKNRTAAVKLYPPGPERLAPRINTILCDSRSNILAGTRGGGLLYYDKGRWETYTRADGLPADRVTCIFEDRGGDLWVGTRNGVARPGRTHRPHKGMRTYLPGHAVIAIHEDRDGVLWFGAGGHGLIRFDGGKAVYFNDENGLGSNYFAQITPDGLGNFWLAGLHGIRKVRKRELDDFAAAGHGKINAAAFGLSDGMLHVRCSNSPLNGVVRAPEGELWFATQKGVAAVKPGKVFVNKTPPPVVLKKILFNGRPVRQTGNGQTFKGIKNLRFYFTAPTFIAREKVKLFYRLEGYDPGWRTIEAFDERTAVYDGPPPGRYCFRVTAANSDGVRNPMGAAFEFTLTRYFYRTPLFILGVFLLVAAAAWAGVRHAQRYLHLKKLRDKYKHSTLDPDEAEAALKKLRYLMEVKKIFKDENLSLNALSAKLTISPRYLSQVMNERLSKNFWDVLNGYRVAEAQKILSASGEKEKSVLETAFEVGFNSKGAFNRAFKKYAGMTPTQFKNSRS